MLLVLPVVELLGDVQVLQMVVNGPLVLLQEGIRVPQTVTSLSLHHLVSKLPGQLQGFPKRIKKLVHEIVRTQKMCNGVLCPLDVVLAFLTGSTLWLR